MSPGRSPTSPADDGLRVWAVVVTFDRVERLASCLEALRGQTRPPERILVVDNGSGPETRAFLHRASQGPLVGRLEVLRLGENLGPAGGFAAGLERASAGSATHLWLMDDDVLPAGDALENLLTIARTETNELIFPAIYDEAGRRTDYPGWSGVLLASDLVRRAGVPEAGFFWWIEDTEYLQWRLPHLHQARVERCPRARVVHGSPAPEAKPAWKFYYEIRNTLIYRLKIQTTRRRRRWWRALRVVVRSLLRILLREAGKGPKLVAWGRGLGDGLRGRLGKTLEPGSAADGGTPDGDETT